MAVLRIATRGSDQARIQSQAVADQLQTKWPDLIIEFVIISTTGDQRSDVPLHQIGGQGLFVKEVQNAVLIGQADVAVHSAKDLPAATHPELVIAAFMARRDPRDALVGAQLSALANGATIATGSVRRKAQLQLMRPDLNFVELRGNILSRLQKVPDGGAIVVAAAAIEILQQTDRVAQYFAVSDMVPMVGQGCVAVECRQLDNQVRELLATVDHEPSRTTVELERVFLDELGAGCSLPIGAHIAGSELHVFLSSDPDPDDKHQVKFFKQRFVMPTTNSAEQFVRAIAQQARAAVA